MPNKLTKTGGTDWVIGESIYGEDLNDTFNSLNSSAPIGTIVAYLKDFTNAPDLPDDWLECNGQTISDSKSPMNGEAVPDLNFETYDSGTATSGTNTTLTDTSKTWDVDELVGKYVYITGGNTPDVSPYTGIYSGIEFEIISNTADTITIKEFWWHGAYTNGMGFPDNTTTYKIGTPHRFVRGNSTSGGTGGDGYQLSSQHAWNTIEGSDGIPPGVRVNTTGYTDIIFWFAHWYDNKPPHYTVVWVIKIK